MIRRIVDALAVRASGSEQQRLARPPTTNLEAYDYYLRAEQAARTGFQPKLRQALQLYEKAIALDPAFAEAYAADARTVADVMRNDYNDVLAGPWRASGPMSMRAGRSSSPPTRRCPSPC